MERDVPLPAGLARVWLRSPGEHKQFADRGIGRCDAAHTRGGEGVAASALDLLLSRTRESRSEVEVKFLLFLAAVLGGAWYYFKPLPPGQGPNADAGKRAATPVLRTLESYRGERGYYPEDLEYLVPDYLSKMPRLSNGASLEYQRLGSSYRLTFNYTNPLPVHCTFRPESKWNCEWF